VPLPGPTSYGRPMDRATSIFLEELSKTSADIGGRKRTVAPAGAIQPKRDEGEIQQGKVTFRENQGTFSFDSAPDVQSLKDKRRKEVRPGQPESPWRATKVAQDRACLLDPDSPPLRCVACMTEDYGKEWLEWEPETLWETIRKDYQTYPNEETKNKLMAVKAVMANDYFWQEWDVFEKVCSAFNGRIPNFGNMEDLSIAELALGAQLVSKLKKRSFKNEVQAYVASRAHEEGYVMLPEVLSFAQGYLDDLMQGTEGPVVKEKLLALGDPLELKVTDDTDPVHIQAGLLQAVSVYLKSNDTAEVKA